MKTIQKLTAAILLTASCAGLSVSCVPRSETKNLKIICYNILYGMRRDTTQGKRLFAEWVRQQNPDILALQEVNDFTQFTLETLAAEYGHDYAVISKDPKLIPGSVGSRTKFPVSISSKSPVVNVDKVLDNMWHGFIKCKVEGYNVIVLHLNPHLYEARRREIRTVLETVKQSGLFEKWIIMGDFNTVSPLDSAVYADGKYLQRKMRDANRPRNRNRIILLTRPYKACFCFIRSFANVPIFLEKSCTLFVPHRSIYAIFHIFGTTKALIAT